MQESIMKMLIDQGVLAVMLAWFMFRLDRQLERHRRLLGRLLAVLDLKDEEEDEPPRKRVA